MGMLDGVLGGLVSAAVVPLIQNVIQQHGGVQGLIGQFEKSGLGSSIQSWVGTGTNHSITAEQIQQVLGSDAIKTLAAKVGISSDEVAQKLAEALPAAVDNMTPNGTVPTAEAA